MELKIIKSENYVATKKVRAIVWGTFLLSIVLVGRRGNGLLSVVGLQEALGGIVGLIGVVAVIIGLGLYIYSRKVKKTGKLNFTEDGFSITYGSQSRTINYAELSYLKIEHNSYVGEDYKSDPTSNFKGDNWIEFGMANGAEKIEFEVNSHYKSNSLPKLADSIRKQFPDLVYVQY